MATWSSPTLLNTLRLLSIKHFACRRWLTVICIRWMRAVLSGHARVMKQYYCGNCITFITRWHMPPNPRFVSTKKLIGTGQQGSAPVSLLWYNSVDSNDWARQRRRLRRSEVLLICYTMMCYTQPSFTLQNIVVSTDILHTVPTCRLHTKTRSLIRMEETEEVHLLRPAMSRFA